MGYGRHSQSFYAFCSHKPIGIYLNNHFEIVLYQNLQPGSTVEHNYQFWCRPVFPKLTQIIELRRLMFDSCSNRYLKTMHTVSM